jgi:hypothetical protein
MRLMMALKNTKTGKTFEIMKKNEKKPTDPRPSKHSTTLKTKK